jgi:hypothetical protein
LLSVYHHHRRNVVGALMLDLVCIRRTSSSGR